MKIIRKIAARVLSLLIGLPLLLLGIVLIPLPGPGLLVCLLAFFVLSLGFDWPKPYLERALQFFKKLWSDAMAEAERRDKDKS